MVTLIFLEKILMRYFFLVNEISFLFVVLWADYIVCHQNKPCITVGAAILLSFVLSLDS